MYDYNQTGYEARERMRRRRRTAEAERARPRDELQAGEPQGIQVFRCLSAICRSRGPSSASRTGVTTDQRLPTGQRWILAQPRRSAFTESPGIQSVLNREPRRTGSRGRT